MVALAALEKGLNPEDLFNCKGKFRLGNRTFHCWKDSGHGLVNLTNAIKTSCNVYFFNIAKQIPGKEEFYETIRYYNYKIKETGVNLQLGEQIDAAQLIKSGYDEVVLATGIRPRELTIQGADLPKVLSYVDVVQNKAPVGKRVAIIGAGGIGFDIAEFLADEGDSTGRESSNDIEAFNEEWGIDGSYSERGALSEPNPAPAPRSITMLQRKTSKMGKSLGKTTGWIHRTALAMKRVQMITGVEYTKIDDLGLHFTIKGGKPQLIECDNVVVCAGQISRVDLLSELEKANVPTHLIGGSKLAGELDAKRAILEGFEVAAAI